MKYKLGKLTAKALMLMGAYIIFSICELNFNIIEWSAIMRLLVVVVGLVLISDKVN